MTVVVHLMLSSCTKRVYVDPPTMKAEKMMLRISTSDSILSQCFMHFSETKNNHVEQIYAVVQKQIIRK
jgi:hypothetical protein